MGALPGHGIHDVLVVCPGFSVDCLETIEEIKILNRDIFLAAGGKRFTYVKALNASWDHTNVILDIINKYQK
jgi:ferrochelatase